MSVNDQNNPPIDRSRIDAEVYPGAANDHERVAQEMGGWRCERHPHLPFGHDGCAGPVEGGRLVNLYAEEVSGA